MRGSPFFQKKTHYGLAVILVIILLSSLFDSREHFNLHIKPPKHPRNIPSTLMHHVLKIERYSYCIQVAPLE